MSEVFTGSFTQQEPIPEEGIEAALAVLRSGRLHRYNTRRDEISETARKSWRGENRSDSWPLTN